MVTCTTPPFRAAVRLNSGVSTHMMPHGWSLLTGIVGTVKGRLGFAGEVLLNINSEYDALIKHHDWLGAAPFSTIHYILCFGEKSDEKIRFSRISTKFDELPVTSQLSMRDLHEVFLNKDHLHAFLGQEVRRVLCAVGEKYKLSALPFPQ